VNSRSKGVRGELELAHYLTEHGFPATRGQQFKGGSGSPDVICESLPGLHLECKRTERVTLHDWLAQAISDAGKGKVPVVAHKRNRSDWVAILPLEDLLKLVMGV
jgi:Holliday junction resolvase